MRRGRSLAVVMRVRCNAMHEGSVRRHAAIGGVQGCRAAVRVVVVLSCVVVVEWTGGCVYVYTTAGVWAQMVGAVREVVGVGDGNE